jgi:hypothetical protein
MDCRLAPESKPWKSLTRRQQLTNCDMGARSRVDRKHDLEGMTDAQAFARCIQCGCPAPIELGGSPDADVGDFTEWAAGADAEPICPGCLTLAKETAIADEFLDFDPLVALPRLIVEFRDGRIDAAAYKDRLLLLTPADEEWFEPTDEASAVRELLSQAWGLLPRESPDDLTATRAHPLLDRLRERAPELFDELFPADDANTRPA